MYEYIDRMEAGMTEGERDALRRIYEPTVVCIPPADSRRDLCVMKNGELRAYEAFYGSEERVRRPLAYLSSVDGGISWKRHDACGMMRAATYVERAGMYISIATEYNGESGLWVLRSAIGPGDPNPEIIELSRACYGDVFLPKASAFTDRIWFTSQRWGAGEELPVATYHYSDDFGKTWNVSEVNRPDGARIVFPHKGHRWHIRSGVEPYVEELSEARMAMMIRSPHDAFYISYSEDGGESWSDPVLSTFYGTNTTPFMLRMRDGRVVTLWNNTRPLPERNYRKDCSEGGKRLARGRGEDVFTNRDAAHAAISEDGGRTQIGYREILLNPIRGAADFRYRGSPDSSHDKSVHQFQAFELPYGKLLISVGQNEASRRLLIMDVKWLYETERREDFLGGLEQLTTHTYVKSNVGSTVSAVGNGHCAYNRAQNAYLLPDPDRVGEVLYICKRHDDRLINDIGGVTWNFPASARGRVTVELKLLEKQARVSLADRWYNTCDPYIPMTAPFWFEVDASELDGEWATLTVDYDTEEGLAVLSVNGEERFCVSMTALCPTGISYLILQCATDGDSRGFYVRRMEKTDRK